jgi:signal transduction histidine kinase
MHAQETEAARIARELHDDLGQSLALLGVQLQSAIQLVAPASPKAKSVFLDVRNRIGEIAHRVSSLSHQLHSSELDYLGLPAAAAALCRMVSEQHRVRVQCSSAVSTRLQSEIELCLYRILQEALKNAVSHGRATSIEVSLGLTDTAVNLRVTDNGCGFHVKRPTTRPGLGLISMRERATLVGGECRIQSTVGQGTVVEATVPIPKPTVSSDPGSDSGV